MREGLKNPYSNLTPCRNKCRVSFTDLCRLTPKGDSPDLPLFCLALLKTEEEAILMSPKERYEWLWEEVKKPLPHWTEVWRQAYIDGLKQANERPVLDLTDESC